MNNVLLPTSRAICVALHPVRSTAVHHLFQCFRHSIIPSVRQFTSTPSLGARVRFNNSVPPPPQESVDFKPPGRRIRYYIGPTHVHQIFGSALDWKQGNLVLHELQRRRISGSLVDHGVAFRDIAISPVLAHDALRWLRKKYPVDEAVAGERYAERELAKYKAHLSQGFVEKAQKWRFVETVDKKSKVRDIVDDSIIVEKAQKWQAARNLRDQKRKEQEALALAEFDEKSQQRALDLQKRRELFHEQREEKLKKWQETAEKAMLETEAITDQSRSVLSRLFPSTLFGLSVIAVASFFLDSGAMTGHIAGFTWDTITSPEAIACMAITAVHVVVWFAWRYPGTMWYMNRYFMLSAGAPRPFSLFGAALSHQFFYWHLIANTAVLFAIGVPLQQEIGMSNFWAIYLIAGIFGNLSTLYIHVLRRNFMHVSLGASGALFGVAGASLITEPYRHYTIPYTTIEFNVSSWAQVGFVGSLLLFEHRVKTVDHMVHRAGYLIGVMMGWMLQTLKTNDANLDQAHSEDDGHKW